MDVRIRDTQKTVEKLANATKKTICKRTEYEEVEQELVSYCSVLLEDLHVYSRPYHEQNHEDSLRGYVDSLHGCSSQCPCRWWIWRLHVRLHIVSFGEMRA